MVSIPKSPGIIQRPTTETGASDVNLSFGQAIPQAISKLGSDVENVALQLEQERRQEEKALNAAKVLGFKTQLSKFENEAKRAFKDTPSADINKANLVHKSFLENRNKFIEQQSEQFKDNPELVGLINQQALANSIEFDDALAVELSNKKREYGQQKVYEGIYEINTRLSSGGNAAAAKKDLEETLQVGLNSGLIDIKDVIREREKQTTIIKEKQKELAERMVFNSVASGSTYLDPNNSKHQNYIDSEFSRFAGKNPQQIEQTGFDIAVKQGIIPTPMKNIWIGRLTQGNPQQQVQAASVILDLISERPLLDRQFKDEDLKLAYQMKSGIDAGIPPEKAVKYALDEVSKYSNLDRLSRIQVLDRSKKDVEGGLKSLKSDLTDQPGFDFLKSDIVVPLELEDQYNRLVKNAVADGSPIESAMEAAKTKISGEWAVTNIGQKRLQRLAPEAFFQGTGNNKWIKGQLVNKLAEAAMYPSLKEAKKDLDNIRLEPIPDSIVAGQPSYWVMKQNRFQQFDFERDSNNQPVIFTPDFTKTEQAKDLIKTQEEVNQRLSSMELTEAVKKRTLTPKKIKEAINYGANTKYGVNIK